MLTLLQIKVYFLTFLIYIKILTDLFMHLKISKNTKKATIQKDMTRLSNSIPKLSKKRKGGLHIF